MRRKQTAPPSQYRMHHFYHTLKCSHTCLHRYTCIHAHAYKQYKKQKLIRTNKACLNVQLHISVHTHTHTHLHRGSINLFRLVVCFNYYNQPFSPPNNSHHVCSCSCQKQAETISSVSRETNTVSSL